MLQRVKTHQNWNSPTTPHEQRLTNDTARTTPSGSIQNANRHSTAAHTNRNRAATTAACGETQSTPRSKHSRAACSALLPVLTPVKRRQLSFPPGRHASSRPNSNAPTAPPAPASQIASLSFNLLPAANTPRGNSDAEKMLEDSFNNGELFKLPPKVSRLLHILSTG